MEVVYLVVSSLALYSDDTSLTPPDVKLFGAN